MVTFYLFTDGGGFAKPEGGFDGVSAYRIYIHDDNGIRLLHSNEKVTEGATGQFGEISAISNGLEHICLYMKDVDIDEKVSVQIYTDSMLYMKALTEWIFSWIRKAREGILYSTAGTPVVNQEQIKSAFRSMIWLKKQKAKVRFYHINSHYSEKKIGSLKIKFQKTNNCTVSDEEFYFIYKGNQACDDAIQRAYAEFVENKKLHNIPLEEKNNERGGK